MGGSIPKEKYIQICCYYFPLFRRKMLHFTREKHFAGVKCRPPKVQNMVTEYHYYHCHNQRL